MSARMPPKGFVLSDKNYNNKPTDGYGQQIAVKMRELYPELSHWNDSALVEAHVMYGDGVKWRADFSIPETRNEDLIGYLYARQLMPIYIFLHFEPNNISEAWQHYDAGTTDIHAINLFNKVPAISDIFKTKEHLLESLKKYQE